MIKLTKRAAEQVRTSASEGGMEDLALRIAAKKNDDGTFEYGLGFDAVQDSDRKVESEGISIVVSEDSGQLLEGAVVDFVELEPGQAHFIFLNPQDPNYVPPSEADLADVPPSAGKH
jgi:iron-sulfur cluster assembly protein